MRNLIVFYLRRSIALLKSFFMCLRMSTNVLSIILDTIERAFTEEQEGHVALQAKIDDLTMAAGGEGGVSAREKKTARQRLVNADLQSTSQAKSLKAARVRLRRAKAKFASVAPDAIAAALAVTWAEESLKAIEDEDGTTRPPSKAGPAQPSLEHISEELIRRKVSDRDMRQVTSAEYDYIASLVKKKVSDPKHTAPDDPWLAAFVDGEIEIAVNAMTADQADAFVIGTGHWTAESRKAHRLLCIIAGRELDISPHFAWKICIVLHRNLLFGRKHSRNTQTAFRSLRNRDFSALMSDLNIDLETAADIYDRVNDHDFPDFFAEQDDLVMRDLLARQAKEEATKNRIAASKQKRTDEREAWKQKKIDRCRPLASLIAQKYIDRQLADFAADWPEFANVCSQGDKFRDALKTFTVGREDELDTILNAMHADEARERLWIIVEGQAKMVEEIATAIANRPNVRWLFTELGLKMPHGLAVESEPFNEVLSHAEEQQIRDLMDPESAVRPPQFAPFGLDAEFAASRSILAGSGDVRTFKQSEPEADRREEMDDLPHHADSDPSADRKRASSGALAIASLALAIAKGEFDPTEDFEPMRTVSTVISDSNAFPPRDYLRRDITGAATPEALIYDTRRDQSDGNPPAPIDLATFLD